MCGFNWKMRDSLCPRCSVMFGVFQFNVSHVRPYRMIEIEYGCLCCEDKIRVFVVGLCNLFVRVVCFSLGRMVFRGN